MSGNDDDKDYRVGFGRPPKHTQFKPGQSGNPKGRPKNSKNSRTLVQKVLDEKIEMKATGKSRKIEVREAVIRKTVQGAMEGKPAPLKKVLGWIEQTDPAANVQYVIRAPAPMTREEWERANSPNYQPPSDSPVPPLPTDDQT